MNMNRKKKTAAFIVALSVASLLTSIAMMFLGFVSLPSLLWRVGGDRYFSSGNFESAEAMYGRVFDEGLRESRLIAIKGMKEITRVDQPYYSPAYKSIEKGVSYLRDNGFTVELQYEIDDEGSIFSDVYAPEDGKIFREDDRPIPASDGGYFFDGWKRTSYSLDGERRIVISFSPTWKETGYRISYIGVDYYDNPNPKDYIIDEKVVLLPPTGASAEDFVGWYSDPEFTHEIKEVKRSGVRNVVVYAKHDREPIPIYSVEDFRGNPGNGTFVLMSDIKWEGSNSPLMTESVGRFSGYLYGNGHTVTISCELFGENFGAFYDLNVIATRPIARVNSGVISNCDFEIFYNDQGSSEGGIVDGNLGIITDCSVRGRIVGCYIWIGGIAGYNIGLIEKCSANVDIVSENTYSASTETASVGGLVGVNFGCIFDSYSKGDVSVESAVAGGFVGVNQGSIERAYAIGRVTSTANEGAGGFVGAHTSSDTYEYRCTAVYIRDCFAGGRVTGRRSGGFIGVTVSEGDLLKSIGNVYRIESTNSNHSNEVGEVQPSKTLRSIAFQRDVIGFDSDVWKMIDDEFPTLVGKK